MCARENCDVTSGRVMSGSMPRTFAIGSDNRLLLSEGLTAGEEVEKMWTGERQGLPLNSLEALSSPPSPPSAAATRGRESH